MDGFHWREILNVHFEEGSNMKLAGKHVGARRVWKPATTLLVAFALMVCGMSMAPSAAAADLLNVTLHVPATIYDNPCTGEPVGLHGDLHILYSARIGQGGRIHYLSTLNGSYTGAGLISGTAYTASERKQESWTAKELPASHTTTSVVKLISKGGAANAFLFTTMTTTIDADGVPTPTVDSESVQCRG
jgi:type 1 fimbria pilin